MFKSEGSASTYSPIITYSAMDSSQVSDKLWDYIFVGGGLSASVVSHRLYEHDSNLKILIVEAGPNVNDRADIVWPNSTNLIGGEFDWKYNTTSQANLNGRSISLPCGKALGGGTAINSSGSLTKPLFTAAAVF